MKTKKDKNWHAMERATNPRYCSVCNHRIRGVNHEEGTHHQKAVRERKR